MRTIAILALVTLALSVGLSFAHVLEMPVKLLYAPELYAAVNSTLYYGFGTVGAAIVVMSVLLTSAWALMAWRRRAPRWGWGLAAAVLVWAGLVTWWAAVQPVNAAVYQVWMQHVDPKHTSAETWQSPPPAVVEAWQHRHRRWEYGHTAVWAINLAAYVALLLATTATTRSRPGM